METHGVTKNCLFDAGSPGASGTGVEIRKHGRSLRRSRRTIFALGLVACNVQTARQLKRQMPEGEAETVGEHYLPGRLVARDDAPIAVILTFGDARFPAGRGCLGAGQD